MKFEILKLKDLVKQFDRYQILAALCTDIRHCTYNMQWFIKKTCLAIYSVPFHYYR